MPTTAFGSLHWQGMPRTTFPYPTARGRAGNGGQDRRAGQLYDYQQCDMIPPSSNIATIAEPGTLVGSWWVTSRHKVYAYSFDGKRTILFWHLQSSAPFAS